MPEELESKITWLFILLPGFLSSTIIGQIVDLGQLSEFQIVFYSFVLTLVNLSIALLVSWLIKVLVVKCGGSLGEGVLKGFFYTIIVIVSIASGVILGFAAEKGSFFVILRSLPITDELNKRSSNRPLVFLLSQNSTGKLRNEGDGRPKDMKMPQPMMVRIHLKSKRIYEGWPEYYELGKIPSEIYLSPACELISESGKEIQKPICGAGVIIYEREIESISFIDSVKSNCRDIWYEKKTACK